MVDDPRLRRPPRDAEPPIAGYDDLTDDAIARRLPDLALDALRAVRAHEEANRRRPRILAVISDLLAERDED